MDQENHKALINQGVGAAMAEAEASRVRNGDDSNNFKGTEGVVGLTRWFEKMESVFSISNCTTSSQVNFATCTLNQNDALYKLESHVKASKPKTMQEAIEFSTDLMDDKTNAYAERQAERKRKYKDLSKNNQNQQQQNKRQNTGQAYTAGNSDRKPYAQA
ncbi:hypothetical protein Tco_0794489 [Tanacetum coccineum]